MDVDKRNLFSFRNLHLLIVSILLVSILILYYNWKVHFDWFWFFFVNEFGNEAIGIISVLPYCYSIVFLHWRISIAVWIATLTLMFPYINHYAGSFLENIIILNIIPAIFTTSVLAVRWQKKQKQTEIDRNNERKLYFKRLLAVQEEERRRIAQELHDDTVQTISLLSGILGKLTNEKPVMENPPLLEIIKWGKSITEEITEGLRRIMLDLRPSLLDSMGLLPALRWHVDVINKTGKIPILINTSGEPVNLGQINEAFIFRIVQEAIHNSQKHSSASKITLSIIYSDRGIKILVTDNGIGFDLGSNPVPDKMGIIGMKERARALNANFEIRSKPMFGTEVKLEYYMRVLKK